jgi:shikimate dehydrogenase
MPYAEVIGDPIEQSKSPTIHKYWLEQIGLTGDFRRTRVPPAELAAFIGRRRSDPEWRGCSVTIPHKEKILAHLDRLDGSAAQVGAVNCVVPGPTGLVGYNTDIDGVATALGGTQLEGEKAAIIGAGGGARAVVAWLAGQDVARIAIAVRDPKKAEPLRELAHGAVVEIVELSAAGTAFEGAAVIVNASPLGMAGSPDMPSDLLAAVARHASGATLFDMVYKPLETRFLATGRESGGRTVDGLTMLIGQAAKAFELFFGEPAPASDDRLRDLLTT